MNREELKKLYLANNLSKDEIFIMQRGGKEIPIITRPGIERIQQNNNISVSLELVYCGEGVSSAVVKASAFKEDAAVVTFGEANSANCKVPYMVAMAEKRAKSRAILQIEGFKGVYSEDEFDAEPNFQYDEDMLIQLLKTSSFEGKVAAQISLNIQNIKNQTQYSDIYFELMGAQLNRVDGGLPMSQTDILNQMKKQGL